VTTTSSSAGKKRIGIFGGTFDPVHNGHLHIAREVRQALDLDRIIWVPAGRPPHKRGQIVSDDQDRVAMLELALADMPRDAISTIELDRPGPSYTADTLEQLRRKLAPAELVFIMGEDSLRDFPTWKDPRRILAAAELAVAGRPGIETDIDDLVEQLPVLKNRVTLVSMEELPVSSSEIRRRVGVGEAIDDLAPAAVAEYIEREDLYRAPGALTPNPSPSALGEGLSSPDNASTADH
jgi:nicotinate-nucleotide adenylyltransferase